MRIFHQRSLSSSNSVIRERKHISWLTSPVNEVDVIGKSNDNGNGRKASLDHFFREHHECTTAELFYDLFFVANLATFTDNHEISNLNTLKNYVGFFSILWFTWLETAMFDIRFSTDSVVDRLGKVFSFGILAGIAMCGVLYETDQVAESHTAFQALSMVLMLSRLSLSLQYALVAVQARNHKKARDVLLKTSIILLLFAMAYLGISFCFSKRVVENAQNAYYAWYGLVVLEALIVVAVTWTCRATSFQDTPVIERMGLLTLIVMGEGIIGITKSVSAILLNSKRPSATDIVTVLVSVLLIYFIYVLYFDAIEPHQIGYIRTHLWTLLHFPLHLALLLTVEGAAALILWNISKNFAMKWVSLFQGIDWAAGFSSNAELCNALTGAIDTLSSDLKVNVTTSYDYRLDLQAIGKLNYSLPDSVWSDQANQEVNKIFTGIENVLFRTFGVAGEEPENPFQIQTADQQTADMVAKVETAFVSFYFAAGLFLIALALLYLFGKRKKSWEEWTAVALRVAAGVGIGSTNLANYASSNSAEKFVASTWLIPIVTIGYFIVIVIDNALVWSINRRSRLHASQKQQLYQEIKGDNAVARVSLPEASGEHEGAAHLLASYGIDDTESARPAYMAAPQSPTEAELGCRSSGSLALVPSHPANLGAPRSLRA